MLIFFSSLSGLPGIDGLRGRQGQEGKTGEAGRPGPPVKITCHYTLPNFESRCDIRKCPQMHSTIFWC